jgi:pimeloyl-ACP methyl ester carboxylesterase
MTEWRRIMARDPFEDSAATVWFGRALVMVALCLIACFNSGCSNYFARRITQAPNTYPTWLAPQPRVVLDYDAALSTNLPSRYLEVGPPEAKLRYRMVPAGDYEFVAKGTNRLEKGREFFEFSFNGKLPGKTNEFTSSPRGTVVLLHGYGLGGYAMLPWALQLAHDGWRCVLVDFRGHGKSTGKQISYGIHESKDLSQLLDALEREGELCQPVGVVGVSYGASIALRWKGADPRVGPVVAIAPYTVLSNAVINICDEYASCMPLAFPRAGMKMVPSLLGVAPDELDPLAVVSRNPVKCLLIAADDDKITPVAEMQRLQQVLAPGSRMVIVLRSKHEYVCYQFSKVTPLVEDWLKNHASGDDKAALVR